MQYDNNGIVTPGGVTPSSEDYNFSDFFNKIYLEFIEKYETVLRNYAHEDKLYITEVFCEMIYIYAKLSDSDSELAARKVFDEKLLKKYRGKSQNLLFIEMTFFSMF
jgi:hypothetical protein